MTHTYALLPVPAAMFELVKAKLLDAGYQHAVHPSRDGHSEAEVLDMHGLALVAEIGKDDRDAADLRVKLDERNASLRRMAADLADARRRVKELTEAMERLRGVINKAIGVKP